MFTESDYAKQVQTDGAGNYWKLNDPAGSNPSTDWVGGSDLTVGAGVTLGAAGAIIGSDDTAGTFSGTTTGLAATSQLAPPPDVFTAEAWVKTNSIRGGKILGFGSAATGASSSYDRHIYMDNGGRISFGVYTGAVKTVRGLTAYNDNQWHHVVGSLSSAGMTLYVDGLKIGTDPSVTAGQAYNGYWRVGGDNLGSWPNIGTSQLPRRNHRRCRDLSDRAQPDPGAGPLHQEWPVRGDPAAAHRRVRPGRLRRESGPVLAPQ